MKLNKTRQKLYLDGKVGLINDGTVDQLREVTNNKYLKGALKQYNVLFEYKDIHYHPISWFYENETELPKVGEWWECVGDIHSDWDDSNPIRYYKGKKYLCENNECLTDETNDKYHTWCNPKFSQHFTKSTPPTQTSYKLNIDIPEWVLKAGDEIESGRLPRSIMEYIATPCITFTLENGTEIELTQNDIDKIKKL
jgi:hypothetical protein